jgi:beta-lactamase regulating signal transducer with metallopeptidase domain/protocatechuate 3,4-dioxygenase beta subunit
MNPLFPFDLPASESWLPVALDVLLKGTVLLAAALFIVLAARRASAATRHLVCGLALYGLLVLPVLSLLLPAWRVDLLPPIASATADAGDTPVAPPADALPAAAPERPAFPPKQVANARPSRSPEKAAKAAGPTEPRAESETPSPAAAVALPAPLLWAGWLRIVWAGGVGVMLTPLAAGLLGLVWLARRGQRVTDPAWVRLVETLAAELGVRRTVTLLRCDHGTMPMTWGLVRPVILLPADADCWPAERRRLVLLHELAHVQRRDCLTQLLAQVACALYWFHPLAWLAARQLRRERERACDDQVLLTGSRASDYAFLLLETARSLRPRRIPSPAAVAMAQRSQLEGRLLAVLDPGLPRQPLTRRKVGLTLATGLSLLVPLAAFRPWAEAGGGGKPAAPSPAKAKAPAGKQVMVTGRVLGTDGKPVPGAHVAILTFPERMAAVHSELEIRFRVLGQTRSDTHGRFRLKVPRMAPLRIHDLSLQAGQVVATAKGYAMGLGAVPLDAAKAEAAVRLEPEQVLHLRLIDLQGAGARALRLRLMGVMEERNGREMGALEPAEKVPGWPGPWVTDDRGRCTLHGFSARQQVQVVVDDERYALKVLHLGGKAGSKQTVTLAPSQGIEGRVTYEDTGKPVAGARVRLNSSSDPETRTDRDGRYRLNPPAAQSGGVHFLHILPPDDRPYIGVIQELEKPRLGAKRRVDARLPRGVLVRGRVTEEPSGKPVGGAIVYFWPQNYQSKNPRRQLAFGSVFPVTTDRGGRFRIPVIAGRGHLVAEGPGPDYVVRAMGENFLNNNKPGGGRWYAHAFVPLDIPGKGAPREIDIRLRRGVTVRGRVVGPDGKPATGVQIVTRLNVSARLLIKYEARPLPLPTDRFAFSACDPDQPQPVVFLDEPHQAGAVVSLSGKEAGSPMTVRLARCGKAVARFVDGAGKPLEGFRPSFDLVLVPGVPRYSVEAWQKGNLAADSAAVMNVYQQRYNWDRTVTDAKGRITLPALVPGLTYRLWGLDSGRVFRDFTVKEGQSLDLGDITVKK